MEKVKVKILGVSFAHRKGSATSAWVQYSLKAVEKFGKRVSQVAEIETEFIDLADKEIGPCLACNERFEIPNRGLPWKGEEPPEFGCKQKDDYFATQLMPKMAAADGYIFGSPVYTLSFTSRFRLFWERLCGGFWKGWFNQKPATVIAVGYGFIGGQESCLNDMNTCIHASEMVAVSWAHGTAAVVGTDSARVNQGARFRAVMNARRVAELAVMQKLAIRRLGDTYSREFLHTSHSPHGRASWEWRRLDEEDEKFLMSL